MACIMLTMNKHIPNTVRLFSHETARQNMELFGLKTMGTRIKKGGIYVQKVLPEHMRGSFI